MGADGERAISLEALLGRAEPEPARQASEQAVVAVRSALQKNELLEAMGIGDLRKADALAADSGASSCGQDDLRVLLGIKDAPAERDAAHPTSKDRAFAKGGAAGASSREAGPQRPVAVPGPSVPDPGKAASGRSAAAGASSAERPAPSRGRYADARAFQPDRVPKPKPDAGSPQVPATIQSAETEHPAVEARDASAVQSTGPAADEPKRADGEGPARSVVRVPGKPAAPGPDPSSSGSGEPPARLPEKPRASRSIEAAAPRQAASAARRAAREPVPAGSSEPAELPVERAAQRPADSGASPEEQSVAGRRAEPSTGRTKPPVAVKPTGPADRRLQGSDSEDASARLSRTDGIEGDTRAVGAGPAGGKGGSAEGGGRGRWYVMCALMFLIAAACTCYAVCAGPASGGASQIASNAAALGGTLRVAVPLNR